jgi:hypothetical protein
MMKELTLALVDAQFDANTMFGEVTVAVKGGGHVVRPVPSVGDIVALARALQAALQFHLHSIQALAGARSRLIGQHTPGALQERPGEAMRA